MSNRKHLISLAGAGMVAGGSKPGDVNGQGLTAFDAAWFALSPSGSASGGR